MLDRVSQILKRNGLKLVHFGEVELHRGSIIANAKAYLRNDLIKELREGFIGALMSALLPFGGPPATLPPPPPQLYVQVCETTDSVLKSTVDPFLKAEDMKVCIELCKGEVGRVASEGYVAPWRSEFRCKPVRRKNKLNFAEFDEWKPRQGLSLGGGP